MCFDHLFKFYVSYCYYIAQAIHGINLFIPSQTCFKWHGYSSFKKEGKTQIFKMYIFVKLFKEDETKYF
jgi:hypothetical protein